MAKTLIDVDEDQLVAAQKILKAKTKKEPVNAAHARSRRWLPAAGICSASFPAGCQI